VISEAATLAVDHLLAPPSPSSAVTITTGIRIVTPVSEREAHLLFLHARNAVGIPAEHAYEPTSPVVGWESGDGWRSIPSGFPSEVHVAHNHGPVLPISTDDRAVASETNVELGPDPYAEVFLDTVNGYRGEVCDDDPYRLRNRVISLLIPHLDQWHLDWCAHYEWYDAWHHQRLPHTTSVVI
jgi:hypothetical protein